jgi:hypothetical protein
MTLSITTLSITSDKKRTEHNVTQHNGIVVMLSVINLPFMLRVVILSVIAPDSQHNETQHYGAQYNI